jgi:uncharacterized phiE125 gp8 family phage protein
MTTYAETTLELSTGPSIEPVTVAEAKSHMRVDDATDDTLIGNYIVAARRWAERFTNRQFIEATWKLHMPQFPEEIRLPLPPTSSVTSIVYIDTDGNTQTLDSGEYQTNLKTEPALIKPAYSTSWPDIRGGDYNSVTVTYVTGYGTATTDVPEDIRTAIRILVSHFYEAREPIIVGSAISVVPRSVDALLWPYRVEIFGL